MISIQNYYKNFFKEVIKLKQKNKWIEKFNYGKAIISDNEFFQ